MNKKPGRSVSRRVSNRFVVKILSPYLLGTILVLAKVVETVKQDFKLYRFFFFDRLDGLKDTRVSIIGRTARSI